jgi:HSP20 family protein
MKPTYSTGSNQLVDLFGSDFMEAENGDAYNSIPAIDITEQKDNYKIEMSIPGFRKEDFIVLISDNMLTVSCKKEREEKKNRRKNNFLNGGYMRFTRQLPLPKNADANKVKAKYNGILNLVIEKKQTEKSKIRATRTIPVQP